MQRREIRFCGTKGDHIYMYYEIMINRTLSSQIQKISHSAFLLGPRQTGKSTLIKSLNPDLTINFADEEVFLNHNLDFGILRSSIERKKAKTVFIDEVQRIPQILNTVQALIDEKSGIKTFLTGSSARKLKKGGANLLPGRVLNYFMGALTYKEIEYQMSDQDLLFGFLPGVYTQKDKQLKRQILTSYSANYVNEEIKAEALVKNLPSFSRFLYAAPKLVGKFIDYSKFAQRTKISRHQVARHFEIFEDTMIGQRIFPDHAMIEKYDLIKHPKFYFFDVGVMNGIEKTFDLSDQRRGILREQIAYQQLLHSSTNANKQISIHTFRTRGGVEIDFCFKLDSKNFGIEVKSTDKIIDDDVRHLVQLKKIESKRNKIWCLPIANGLKEIGL